MCLSWLDSNFKIFFPLVLKLVLKLSLISPCQSSDRPLHLPEAFFPPVAHQRLNYASLESQSPQSGLICRCTWTASVPVSLLLPGLTVQSLYPHGRPLCLFLFSELPMSLFFQDPSPLWSCPSLCTLTCGLGSLCLPGSGWWEWGLGAA